MAEILRAEHIRKSFAGRRVLDDVSFTLNSGEKLGITGKSGSGKTTLAMILMSLLKADEGTVFYRGRDISGMTREELLPVQMIFQNPGTTLEGRMTVRSSVLEGVRGPISDEEGFLMDLLHKAALSPAIASKRIRELSGGEQARVAIARTLALRPDAIIADEPTSSLDASLRSAILNVLGSLDIPMIIISHDEEGLKAIASRIVCMADGRLTGSHAEKKGC